MEIRGLRAFDATESARCGYPQLCSGWCQLPGTSFNSHSLFRAADGRIWVEGLNEEAQEPNERKLALVDTHAQQNQEISTDLWFGIALLQE